MPHPLNSLVFFTMPEEHRLSSELPGFDPAIPLPVQLSAPDQPLKSEGITREMILAGILTVLAYDQENTQLEYYRSLIKTVHPTIRTEMTEAAILKIHNGDFTLAEEIFLALQGLDPEDRITTLNIALMYDEQAQSLRSSGLDEQADALDALAFNHYRIAMSSEPAIPDAFFNAGYFYLKQKNFLKARESLQTFLSIETATTPTAKFRKEKAAEIIETIKSRNLDDDMFKTAYDNIIMGNEELALEQIRTFMESHPQVWNGWFLLGWALRRLKRWEDARAAFIQALELFEKDETVTEDESGGNTGATDICNELAICLMELGNFEESRKFLLVALEREPENTKVISNLGMLELRAGNEEEADGFFKTVVELDPNDFLAREMLARNRDDTKPSVK
ncbi:MAG TPA: tetratricopeptide repeat protein [Treponema sp.]|nr:tetratricopeptide repeat protein [Treponema sp.]